MPSTGADHELGAMNKVAQALDGLDDAAKGRVLRWAVERFGVSVGVFRVAPPSPRSAGGAPSGAEDETSLADLVDAANPGTETDRVLVAAYWFQFVRGDTDLDAQSVNAELKNLGHGVKNITRALEALKVRTPALVLQVKKTGTTNQARKKYRVTEAGRKIVEQMVEESKSRTGASATRF